MYRPGLALALLCALGLLLPAVAAAQEAISISVLETRTTNDDHDDLGAEIRKAMIDAVDEIPEFVTSSAITSSYAEFESINCVSPDPVCLSGIAQMMDAPPDRVAWADLQRKAGAWILHVRMLDFGQQRFVVDERWTQPGGADVRKQLVVLAAQAIRGNAPEAAPTARLIVDSDPPGADISLDGRMLGTTPVTQMVTRGRHLVVLSLPGRRTVRKEIDVGVGEVRELIKLPIEPKVVPPSAAPVVETTDWPFWVGVGSGALAGVATVVAAVAWSQGSAAADDAAALNTLNGRDGQFVGPDRAAYDAEIAGLEDDYDSMRALHTGAVITAALAGGAAVYFLVFHEEDAPTVVPTVTPEGAGASVRIEF